ncbi:hypothetical protein HPB52_008794 [Rhipicephalus sanguineus]|uniref:Uncharacterized protein n=1 Tax=Rhipicephalus sanguineus TaxID=34632 RepID=A0A9D4SZQ2_RHISA|nr:hypothetical protein HPB52_008794 [Rhipicephalus sanguineus]
MEPSEVTSERDSLLPNEPCVASMSTPPRSVGKNKSGHILNSDSRNSIFHCYTYWRNREPERSVEDTSKFVAEMLGVSESSLQGEERGQGFVFFGRQSLDALAKAPTKCGEEKTQHEI